MLEDKSLGLYLNLKDCFLADSDEYDLYDLDIGNAEMRILCGYSQDTNLIEVFNSGKDMHCMTGSNPKVSKFSYDDLLAHKNDKSSPQFTVRQAAKTINFGVVYVIGPQGLQKQLYNNLGLEVTEETCAEYIEGFLDAYKGVRSYMELIKMFTKHFNFTYSYTGRRRRFPLIEHTKVGLNKALRQAINFPIQSTSSDLVLRNIINLQKTIKPLGGRVILTVHDSILFQLPKGLTGVKGLLDDTIMIKTKQEFPWLPVPWVYDVGMGYSYGHCNEKVN